MAKKIFSKILILPAAAALFGCASVESHQVGGRSYSFICTRSHDVCVQKADELCGKGRYEILRDTTLARCYGAHAEDIPCKWMTIVECAPPGE